MRERPPCVNVVRVVARLNTGGPAIHTILLTNGLNRDGFRSRLVTGVVGPGEGDMTYYARSLGVDPVVIPELGRDVSPLNDLSAFWKLYRIFRREEPDIIHTHTAKAGGLGRLAGILWNLERTFAGRGPRAKLVHTFHGHIFRGYFSPATSRLLVLVERVLAMLTDRIITVSERIKHDLVEVYKVCPAEKVTVVPLGLDFGWVDTMKRYQGVLRREFHVPSDRVTMGIIGRMTEIKNHRLFVAAARVMNGCNVHSFIIGDGDLREGVTRLVRALGLEGRISITGWYEDAAQIYADLDIVCLTSLNEGTPLVLIEAMAAGRPVVATDVGGVRDLMIGEAARHPSGFEIFANGILAPSGDSKALAAALSLLVERPALRAEMGRVGQRWARGNYSQERLLADIKEVYAGLLSRR